MLKKISIRKCFSEFSVYFSSLKCLRETPELLEDQLSCGKRRKDEMRIFLTFFFMKHLQINSIARTYIFLIILKLLKSNLTSYSQTSSLPHTIPL